MSDAQKPDANTLARTAYEAYATYTGGKTFDGRPMPTWAELPDRIKSAWQAASAAATGAKAPSFDGKSTTIPYTKKPCSDCREDKVIVWSSSTGAPDYAGAMRGGAVVVLQAREHYNDARAVFTAGEARDVGKALIAHADYLDRVAAAVAAVDAAGVGVPG